MRTYILNATGADISPATIIICVVIAAICILRSSAIAKN